MIAVMVAGWVLGLTASVIAARFRSQRDEARADALRQIADMKEEVAAARHYADMAKPTYEAVAAAREALAKEDAAFGTKAAALRQKNYELRLVIGQILNLNVPASERERIERLLGPVETH